MLASWHSHIRFFLSNKCHLTYEIILWRIPTSSKNQPYVFFPLPCLYIFWSHYSIFTAIWKICEHNYENHKYNMRHADGLIVSKSRIEISKKKMLCMKIVSILVLSLLSSRLGKWTNMCILYIRLSIIFMSINIIIKINNT